MPSSNDPVEEVVGSGRMDVLDAPDRWTIEWGNSLAAGKRVTLINRVTGQRCTGHHWSDWDLALRRALAQIEEEGDLVREIEDHLAGR